MYPVRSQEVEEAMEGEDQISQRLLLWFEGYEASPALLAFVQQRPIGGVTLFRKLNLATPAQVRTLTGALQAAARAAGQLPLLICADQEGGQLQAVAGATVENAYTLEGVGIARFGFEYRSGGVVLRGVSQTYVPYVSFEAAAAVTFVRMKPELGKISTLMQAPPPSYGETFERCARYYQKLLSPGIWRPAVSPNTTLVQGMVDLGTPMRIPPTCSLAGTSTVGVYMGDAGFTTSNVTFALSARPDARHLLVNATLTSGVVVTAYRCGMMLLSQDIICDAGI
ncbi:MAG: hypothetical protein EOM24_11370 [Chloroflexia bacterium]|nr:hypothetical protein [Chloroflexia bacterium]